MDKKTAVVALMAVFSLAICFIILGSISVELMEALKIDEAQLGSLVMALFLTSCIVQLIIGPLVDKLGYKPVAITGYSIDRFKIEVRTRDDERELTYIVKWRNLKMKYFYCDD